MDIRLYQEGDRPACLQVFDSLAPHLVDPNLRPAFEKFLDDPAGVYFVLEHDEAIAGCGGFALSSDRNTATLLWGMVRNDCRRLGLGRFLLLYRIREIGKAGEPQMVRVEVPPQSAPFYERQGFRVQSAGKEWVELIKKLTVCP